MSGPAGIYVETLIHAPIDQVWHLTQDPALHQRWDLRFSRIDYLPRDREDEPQAFVYETRIGFGLTIRGTGQSVGRRDGADGSRTSSLHFASQDWKSLICEGSGYWRYLPAADGLRFFTWYDYEVRFAAPGRLFDRICFRPLIGWATAWSFDAMRRWAEEGQVPELSLALAGAYAAARASVATIWIWHGLVPKIIFHQADEQRMLVQSGLPLQWLPLVGTAEICFGIALLALWRWRGAFSLSAGLMVAATVAVALRSPQYLWAAFNPVTLNLAMVALSAAGWLVAPWVPTASRCLRAAPKGKP